MEGKGWEEGFRMEGEGWEWKVRDGNGRDVN